MVKMVPVQETTLFDGFHTYFQANDGYIMVYHIK